MDWDELFPGQTPEQVKAKLAEDTQKLVDAEKKVEEWKGHARTWEDRSKENLTRLQQVEADLVQAKGAATEGGLSAAEAEQLKQRATKAESELALTQKLVGMGADASTLLDSLSFREDISKLDPEAEDYDETLTSLVEERTPKNGGPFVPNYPPGVRRHVAGGDAPKPSLWEEIHGDKKKETNTL